MNDDLDTTLQPEGLHDDLPPLAGFEARVIESLLQSFDSHGYERVAPPVLEFEESLLAGTGAAVGQHMFRVMDPVSHRMMGLRVDITVQVARIAASRLRAEPRPLRLSYAGPAFRIRGTQLRRERQIVQAGVELIGSSSIEADVEILLLAQEVLARVGVNNLSVDLTLAQFVPAICQGLGLDPEQTEIARRALDAKDMAAVELIKGPAGALFRDLFQAAGPAVAALEKLEKINLPQQAAEMYQQLKRLLEILTERAPDLVVTIDPGEFRGFEYHTGVGFSLFARGVRGELGQGGRYLINHGDSKGEPATGFTLFSDTLMRALGEPEARERVYFPLGAAPDAGQKLRDSGLRTVQGLVPPDQAEAEARAIGCRRIYRDGALEQL